MGKVRYSLTDGFAPEKSDGVMRLKSPLDLSLIEGDSQALDLGVSFSIPVVLVENPYMKKQGLTLMNAGTLVLPGITVTAAVKLEEGYPPFGIESRQTVVYALPLDSNFKLEQG